MATANLKKELDYFIAHQDKLVKKYNGKFLVLKDKKVVGVYNAMRDAYWGGQGKYKLGTFAIYHCIPGPQAYSQIFFNRNVIFR